MASGNQTRRKFMTVAAALTGAAALPVKAQEGLSSPTLKRRWDAIVVGAGVFGAWTAFHLLNAGKKVLLVDANGPANARSSSGGETRMIRSDYGADAIYTTMSNASLSAWKSLSAKARLPLFHQTGVLFLFQEMVDYARQSIEVHKELELPLEVLDAAALQKGFPQFNFDGVNFGLYEVGFGALMARRAVQHLVADFVDAGGTYRQAPAETPAPDGHSLLVGGIRETADTLVFACGPWMRKLFPDLLAQRLFITRQEVAFVAPPSGNTQFGLGSLPGWADYNDGDVYYGFPDIEGRGFKIAHDAHGPEIDPDTTGRQSSPETLVRLRAYMERRFPALRGAPFIGDRVCQYTNSSNGDFLIDRHPQHQSVILVGAGSGHGFKHGPEVGRMAAELALNPSASPIKRFGIETKLTHHKRTVL